MNPTVTIAIPVFNRTTYFRQAIESALNQSVPVRVLVVDNASDKVDFGSVLKDYPPHRFEFHRNETNLGMGGNWNRCIELCATPYLLILHDDDFLEPEFVEKFLRRQASQAASLYFCDATVVDAQGAPMDRAFRGTPSSYGDIAAWCFTNPIYAGAVFHVETARRLGGFSTRLRYTLDWDFWMRLALVDRPVVLDHARAFYRVYQSPERGTSQLAGGIRSLRFNRCQFRRNFAHMKAWRFYRMLRSTGDVPRPPLRELVDLVPQLTRRERRYWAAQCAMGPRGPWWGTGLRWLFRLFGPLVFPLLRPWSALRR